jgi:uncharacterized protein
MSRPRLVILVVACLVCLGGERITPAFPWIGAVHGVIALVLAKTLWLSLAPLVAVALGARDEHMGLRRIASTMRSSAFALTLGALLVGLALSALPSLRETYPLYGPARTSLPAFALSTLVFGVYGFMWELYFRGLWVFTIGGGSAIDSESMIAGQATSRRRALAVFAQALLFTIGHIGKPPIELWLSFPGALLAAAYALRARSVLAPFFAHFALSFGVNVGALLMRARYG